MTTEILPCPRCDKALMRSDMVVCWRCWRETERLALMEETEAGKYWADLWTEACYTRHPEKRRLEAAAEYTPPRSADTGIFICGDRDE
jgi:hypothetical protein